MQSLSTKEISERLGYEKADVISMICNGEAKLSIDKIAPLADILNCSAELLPEAGLKQWYSEDTLNSMGRLFKALHIDANEKKWLEKICEPSS